MSPAPQLKTLSTTRHAPDGAGMAIAGEVPAEYDQLRQSLLREHQPANEQEAMLVERIAQCWWKLQRAEHYERELFDDALENGEDIFASKRFAMFLRWRNGLERSWNRARAELARLQAGSRAAAVETQPEPAVAASAQPLRSSAPTPIRPTAPSAPERAAPGTA